MEANVGKTHSLHLRTKPQPLLPANTHAHNQAVPPGVPDVDVGPLTGGGKLVGARWVPRHGVRISLWGGCCFGVEAEQ